LRKPREQEQGKLGTNNRCMSAWLAGIHPERDVWHQSNQIESSFS
jgi:hypothetical protein